jgi:hypothetical protein
VIEKPGQGRGASEEEQPKETEAPSVLEQRVEKHKKKKRMNE